MSNTVIQIKRSTITSTPPDGSLATAEPAYSYLSDKLFIGDSTGSGVIEVGGKYYVDTATSAKTIAIAAYVQANSVSSDADEKANLALETANAAYDKANSANVLAFNTGVGANAFTSATIAGANAAVGAGANAYADSVVTNVGVGANAYTDSVVTNVGAGANAFTSATIAGANAAVGTGANTYLLATLAGANTAVGAGANNYSDATFVKLVAAQQTITGSLSITGALVVSGNAYTLDTETLRISDPLIYLAGNNYVSDATDIGFVGNYRSGTSNLHTGIFRDATSKEYYVFQGYDKEPDLNDIDTTDGSFKLAVLNADVRTSNLNLSGVDATNWITAAYNKANSANSLAFNTGIGANAYADSVGTNAGAGANAYTNSVGTNVGAGANSYADSVGTGANSYLLAVIAGANTAVGAGANSYADLVASNASLLTTGTVPTGRLTGSYTGITGVGTLASGTWNADVITVPYGGTGKTSFTTNGILYGNNAGDLKVTGAGAEGQILQATSTGVPQFGMLDGGNF